MAAVACPLTCKMPYYVQCTLWRCSIWGLTIGFHGQQIRWDQSYCKCFILNSISQPKNVVHVGYKIKRQLLVKLTLYFNYKFPPFHFQWYFKKFKSPLTPTLVPQRVVNRIVTKRNKFQSLYISFHPRKINASNQHCIACTKYWTLRIPCTFAAASLWAWILRAATTADEFQKVVRGQWNTFRDCHWCERLSRHVLLPTKVLWV